jgi:hypothetical protein
MPIYNSPADCPARFGCLAAEEADTLAINAATPRLEPDDAVPNRRA